MCAVDTELCTCICFYVCPVECDTLLNCQVVAHTEVTYMNGNENSETKYLEFKT